MKIVHACIAHETNTFAAQTTSLDDFGRRPPGPAFPAGAAVLDCFRGTRTILGGALAVAEPEAVAVESLLSVFATPSGMVLQDAFESLERMLIERLAQHRDADGFLLELHGAMVTELEPDAEGRLLRTVRDQIGSRPLVATLDLHANTTRAMAELADILIGFDHYPHTDMYERGQEAMRLLLDLAAERVRPQVAWRQIPLLTLPPRQCTSLSPMTEILDELWAIEAQDGVLTGTVTMGFPYADIQDAGAAVVITSDGDPELAERSADHLAEFIWSRRDRFEVDLTPVSTAIRVAVEQGGPVALADGSDNPGGGAPGDETFILQALLADDVPGAVVAVIADPETAIQAQEAGVGATIQARIGGKSADARSEPVAADAYVKLLSDGQFTYRSAMSAGTAGQLGPTAVLTIGQVTVIVVSERVQVWDPEILRCVGIEPSEQKLLALKSSVHFRAAFEPLVKRIFDADTPGVHRPEFACYDYQNVRRPIYPLDPDTAWSAAGSEATE